jgi:hypothetical protein
MLVLSLAMLAAAGIEVIFRTIGRRRIARAAVGGLLSAVFLFEHLSIPLPQSDMRVPPAYAAIAAEPGDLALLDIPLAWRNGFRVTGPIHPGFMFGQFYQTVHTRRLLQGNTSRNPEFKFQYFTQAPLVNSILALETGHSLPPERWAADRALAGDVLRFFDIGYIVVPGPGADRRSPRAALPPVQQSPVRDLSDHANPVPGGAAAAAPGGISRLRPAPVFWRGGRWPIGAWMERLRGCGCNGVRPASLCRWRVGRRR